MIKSIFYTCNVINWWKLTKCVLFHMLLHFWSSLHPLDSVNYRWYISTNKIIKFPYFCCVHCVSSLFKCAKILKRFVIGVVIVVVADVFVVVMILKQEKKKTISMKTLFDGNKCFECANNTVHVFWLKCYLARRRRQPFWILISSTA